MSILSLPFLAFLTVLVLIYYLTPLRFRKWVLLLGSAVFWGLNGLAGTVYLVVETLIIWLCALTIERRRDRKRACSVMYGFTLLLVFGLMLALREHMKLGQLLQGMMGEGSPVAAFAAGLAVPLGISYFTFQSAGYLMDVKLGKVKAERNYFKVLLFSGFFPQITQGPIGTWKDLGAQLDTPHRLEPEQITASFGLMVWGFFKKMVIADRITPFALNCAAHAEELPGWLALLTVIAYTIGLYADFSGGIDIVRGAAGMFGVRLAENFTRPFFACSVGEYWRRWHITLGVWFRDHMMYPLAMSKAGSAVGCFGKKVLGPKVGRTLPAALAAFLVFVLIGLWHALGWNALIFGCWFGLLSMAAILLEPVFKAWKKAMRIDKKTRWFKAWGMVRTWVAVLIAQFFACTNTPEQAAALMSRIALNFETASIGQFEGLSFITFQPEEWVVAAVALGILLMVDILCEWKPDLPQKLARANIFIRWPLVLGLLMIILVFGRYGHGYDAAAFLYAGF